MGPSAVSSEYVCTAGLGLMTMAPEGLSGNSWAAAALFRRDERIRQGIASMHRQAEGFLVLARTTGTEPMGGTVQRAHEIHCLTAPDTAVHANPARIAAIDDAARDLSRAVASAAWNRDERPEIRDERPEIRAAASRLRSSADEMHENARELRISAKTAARLRPRLLRHGQHAIPSGLRRYALLEPPGAGDRVAGWITPRPLPAALDVAGPSHVQLRVSVLARYFPAHTVHAEHSVVVAAASRCMLRATDHYHLHRVSVSLDPLLTPGTPGNDALGDLIADHSASGVARFQRLMRRLADPHEQRETQVSLPVRPACRTSIASAHVVQLGDRSHLDLSTRYVAEETELPAIELLAASPRLVRALVRAVTEPDGTTAAGPFLRRALRAAGCTGELAMLDHSTGLEQPGTSVFALFGVDTVNQATAVMVGHGNTLRTGMRIHRGTLSPGTIRNDLDRLRQQYLPQAEAGYQ